MITGATLLAILLRIAFRVAKASKQQFFLLAYICMAMLPLFSQYGWEYVYVFALPLFLHCVLYVVILPRYTSVSTYLVLVSFCPCSEPVVGR